MQVSATINARYEIRGLVGRGGMGLVYRAYDKIVGREVALKTIGDIQGRNAIEMFYKEWRTLANLHHPNIIEIFDIGEFEDGGVVKPFFVMPLLKGMTLEQILHTPGQQLSAERLCDIISQTCRGLQAIHDSGLVHRDLKPSNIFVLDFNSVKLIDFGIAHLANAETATGLKGTISYMSPEQVSGQQCSAASDIFALGVVCYEALGGVKPFQGKSTDELFEAILHGVPQPIYDLNPAVSQTVSRVVHKALAKEPRHRYASALEMSDTLWKALRGEPIPALDPSRIQPRIQRAIKAFEQGNYAMATEILSDLEASGHIDVALAPLRKQIDQAMRRTKVRDLLDRARMGLGEEEYALALQNAEAALKIDPGNEEASQLCASIQAEITNRDIDEWLRTAGEAVKEYSFSRARQLLHKVLELRPGDPQASVMLQDLESRDQAYRAARQEKERLYRAAKEAWQNAEFNTAAVKIQRVLELEAKAPDTTVPDNGANYANFLELVQSARAAIEQVRVQVPRCIQAGDYKRALELCREAIAKYPGHPIPQALKLAAEAHWRSGTLAKVAELGRAVEEKPDLTGKHDALQKAIQAFPGEPLFENWARPVRDQLALENDVVAKARAHEEHGRFQEALEQWQMLLTIDPELPGLQEELDRVARMAGIAVPPEPQPVQEPATPRASFAPSEPTLPMGPPTAARPQPAPVVEPPPPAPKETSPGWLDRIRPMAEQIAASARERGRALWHWGSGPGIWPLTAAAAALVFLLSAALVVTHFKSAGIPKTTPLQKVRVVLRSATPEAIVTVGTVTGKPGAGVETDLKPAVYDVSVARDGYRTYHGTITVPQEGLQQSLPALDPLDTAVHLSTDLANATVRLDDRPETGLDQSEFAVDDLKPGEHSLTVRDGRSEATFTFTSEPGKAPELKGPIEAKEVLAYAATALGPLLRIMGSAAPASVTVDSAAGTAGTDGSYQFTGLERKAHQVVIGTDKEPRSFAVDMDPHPALWITLLSDRNVGTVTISAGTPSFQVFLDGKAYKGRIRNGAMRMVGLPVKHYKLRVTADGFESAEQDIEVKKGQTTPVTFTLAQIPQYGALLIRGMPARSQVFLDGTQIGSTGEDGSFPFNKVTPGDHTIELRNTPRYKPASIQRPFKANETVTLTEADLSLAANPGSVSLTSAQPGTQFSWTCGQTKGSAEAPATVPCVESQITVTASAAGFREETRVFRLSPGQTSRESFDLRRIAVAPPKVTKTCGADDLAQNGWTREGDWFIAGTSANLPCGGETGVYQFTVLLPSGGFFSGNRSLQWTVQTAGGSSRIYELQKKSFQPRGGTKVDTSKYEQKNSLTFQLVVEAGRIVHKVRGPDSWHQVSVSPGDFKGAKVLFPKDARIANFSFTEQ